MTVGTKSVLYGAHAFWLHPWFVALAWWKLFGFPSTPWLWIAFFVHDLGYWGSPNMDGPEGEEHPWFGARFLYWLQGAWLFLRQPLLWERRNLRLRWWHIGRRWASAHLLVAQQPVVWGNEVLFHSRFFAKRYGAQPSRLCIADKLAICLTPAWLYLPMVRATGEIEEYMELARDDGERAAKYASANVHSEHQAEWYRNVQTYLRGWVEEHRDGRADGWTPDAGEGVGDHA